APLLRPGLALHRGALRHQRINGVVHAEDQQCRCGAESRTGDAVVAVPTAIGVLYAHEPRRGGLVPIAPGTVPVDDERFARLEEAQELLAAIVAEAAEHLGRLRALLGGVVYVPGGIGLLRFVAVHARRAQRVHRHRGVGSDLPFALGARQQLLRVAGLL